MTKTKHSSRPRTSHRNLLAMFLTSALVQGKKYTNIRCQGGSHSLAYFLVHALRSQLPPRPTSWGVSAGRGPLRPIAGDDDWSEEQTRLRKNSQGSYSAMETISSASSGEPSPRMPPSGRKAYELEQKLMNRLLTQAHRHKKEKSISSVPLEYLSSSDSDEPSCTSRSQSDSRFAGYSGDDNWSLASSEFSLEQTSSRQPTDAISPEGQRLARTDQPEKGDVSGEAKRSHKKPVSILHTRPIAFLFMHAHQTSN